MHSVTTGPGRRDHTDIRRRWIGSKLVEIAGNGRREVITATEHPCEYAHPDTGWTPRIRLPQGEHRPFRPSQADQTDSLLASASRCCLHRGRNSTRAGTSEIGDRSVLGWAVVRQRSAQWSKEGEFDGFRSHGHQSGRQAVEEALTPRFTTLMQAKVPLFRSGERDYPKGSVEHSGLAAYKGLPKSLGVRTASSVVMAGRR